MNNLTFETRLASAYIHSSLVLLILSVATTVSCSALSVPSTIDGEPSEYSGIGARLFLGSMFILVCAVVLFTLYHWHNECRSSVEVTA